MPLPVSPDEIRYYHDDIDGHTDCKEPIELLTLVMIWLFRATAQGAVIGIGLRAIHRNGFTGLARRLY